MQVFNQVNQYVFPEYRHHLALFQKRMEVIVQLVFASVNLKPIRKAIESDEKRIKNQDSSSVASTNSSSGSVIESSDSEASESSSETLESGVFDVKNPNGSTESDENPSNSKINPIAESGSNAEKDASDNSAKANYSSETSEVATNTHPKKVTINTTTKIVNPKKKKLPSPPDSIREECKRQFFQTLNDPVKYYPFNRILFLR